MENVRDARKNGVIFCLSLITPITIIASRSTIRIQPGRREHEEKKKRMKEEGEHTLFFRNAIRRIGVSRHSNSQ